MTNGNTYTRYPELADLRKLVLKQRRLEAQIAPLEELQAEEKELRDQIDASLVAAGLEKGDVVTCAGYEVKHNERAGQSRVDGDKLIAIGVPAIDVRWATVTGKASKFATVRPMKGAKVRAA